jgi:hypothetical protein
MLKYEVGACASNLLRSNESCVTPGFKRTRNVDLRMAGNGLAAIKSIHRVM